MYMPMTWQYHYCPNNHLLFLLLLRPAPPLLEGASPAPMALFLLLLKFATITSHALSDTHLLLTFRSSLRNATALADSWKDGDATPCSPNWVGVICQNGAVWGLQLEDMGLSGTIDVDTLSQIPSLRSLSVMGNNLGGPMLDLTKLRALKSLFLARNHFSGFIPDDAFETTHMLKKIELHHNRFTGPIPASLAALPHLLNLRLDGNRLWGRIPDFKQKTLREFNVSNNVLEGPIPPSISTIAASSFFGNKALCGEPLDERCSNKDEEGGVIFKKLAVWMMAIVAVIGILAVLGIFVAVFLTLRKKHRRRSSDDDDQEGLAAAAAAPRPDEPRTKLTFVREEDKGKFDLPDLMKASAEILGTGWLGSSYKAAVEEAGRVMVVKRFKHMNNVRKEEFGEHMRRLGRLQHPNLLPLVAYYYLREEKLLVWDFLPNGSLAQHLHDGRQEGNNLDWGTRVRIIKGVARGLAYLHKELPMLMTPHGHLKSSNILLSYTFDPLLTHYGLNPILNHESAHDLMVAYRSPEFLNHKRITKKTDVWAFGNLILETLTGRQPGNILHYRWGRQAEVEEDLATWVTAAGKNEMDSVVDVKMGVESNNRAEIVKLLRLGLACCVTEVEKRISLREVVERVEEVKDKDHDEDFYSSAASDMGSRNVSLEQINFQT